MQGSWRSWILRYTPLRHQAQGADHLLVEGDVGGLVLFVVLRELLACDDGHRCAASLILALYPRESRVSIQPPHREDTGVFPLRSRKPADGRDRPRGLRLPGALREEPRNDAPGGVRGGTRPPGGDPLVPHLPGGSAANTARGIAWLVRRRGAVALRAVRARQAAARRRPRPAPVFNGAIGRDAAGDEFAARIERAGVHAALVRKDTPTGTSVILVTPDGERTMNTFLGACRDFQVERPGARAAGRLAHAVPHRLPLGHGKPAPRRRTGGRSSPATSGRSITIAFDLADPFAVRRYAEKFRVVDPGARRRALRKPGRAGPAHRQLLRRGLRLGCR